MRRIPRAEDSAVDDYPGEVVAEGDRPQWVEQQQTYHAVEDAEHRVRVLAALLELSQGDLAASRDQLVKFRQREQRHRKRLAKKAERIRRLRAQLKQGEPHDDEVHGPHGSPEAGPTGLRSLTGLLRPGRSRRRD
jgi:hypothetical protein